ncbi:unnamed protein product, partial [Iphiclides podalirius]
MRPRRYGNKTARELETLHRRVDRSESSDAPPAGVVAALTCRGRRSQRSRVTSTIHYAVGGRDRGRNAGASEVVAPVASERLAASRRRPCRR